MNWIKKIFYLIIPSFIIIFGLEFGSKLFIKKINQPAIYSNSYEQNELNKDIPFINKKNGGDCIRISDKFKWNPLWGFSARKLDKKCAKNHFSKKTYNVLFLGGSAMANAEAPNYLTHIDHFSTKVHDNVHSLNLSESGARHKNMSVRLQRELIDLNTNLIIFLDGFNEFNSIRYGGLPQDDFYWTATGNLRMHFPLRAILDKLIEKSSFLELLLIRTQFYNSARVMNDLNIDKRVIQEAANYFLNDIKISNQLCQINEIKCLFILQPQVFGSTISQHAEIINNANKNMPHYQTIIEIGYKYILDNCKICLDASEILNDKPDTFIDPVHFSKQGSMIIGKFISDIIAKELNKNDD